MPRYPSQSAVPTLGRTMRKLIPNTLSAFRWLLTILPVLSLSAWVFTWRWRAGIDLRTDDCAVTQAHLTLVNLAPSTSNTTWGRWKGRTWCGRTCNRSC